MLTPSAPHGPADWVVGAEKGSPGWVFAAALGVAALLHVALLLTLSFDLPAPQAGRGATRPLEVLVLRQPAPSDEEPQKADAVAQVDQEAGGDGGREHRVEQPPDPLGESLEPVARPVREIERKTDLVALPSEENEAATPSPAEETLPEVAPARINGQTRSLPSPEISQPETVLGSERPAKSAVTAAQILASRRTEIAQLTARIERQSNAYAKRQRRKAISASTREYKYANYLEAWRRKVERIGNLNYPQEAKRRKLHGNLILQVAVRSDGTLESTRVLRSSGFEVLDRAAVRIVELAAPFAPFPPDISAETDVLDITRTWQFLSNNSLGWEK
jgi:protein TonB